MSLFSFFTRSRYKSINDDDDLEADPTLPYNLMKVQNFALAMAYFSVGLTMSFNSTPLNIYLVETLNAEPQMQSTFYILQTLPWSLKILFGFISDACPILGSHRKPYLTIGAIIYSSTSIIYSLLGWHDVVFLCITTFIGTLGLIQLDVMADTMCVERSKFEPEETKGQMQASCYSIRFAGSLIGALLGTAVCNQESWGWGLTFMQVSFLNGAIPFLLVTPFLFSLREKYRRPKGKKEEATCDTHVTTPMPQLKNDNDNDSENGFNSSSNSSTRKIVEVEMKRMGTNNNTEMSEISATAAPDDEETSISIEDQIHEIWQTVCLKAVWRPMAFVYIFNLFQVPNVAWQSYLQLALHFEPWILGLTVTLGSFMTFAGILAYKYLFFKASWRSIYVWSVGLTTFFSFLQLLLIFQVNKKYLHLNNYLFSLGDDVIQSYISGIQFLPVCIMYMRLCPDGAEGSSYSMLTTFGNIGTSLSHSLIPLFFSPPLTSYKPR